MAKRKPDFLEYRLGLGQADLFMRDNIKYIDGLIGCESVRGMMVSLYKILINRGLLTAIEHLTTEHKTDLWEQTKEFANGKLDRDNMISLSRSLYTMEYFLNQL